MERRYRFNQLSSILSGAMDTYYSIDALMAPVKMGALAPCERQILAQAGCRIEVWPREGLVDPGLIFERLVSLLWHIPHLSRKAAVFGPHQEEDD